MNPETVDHFARTNRGNCFSSYRRDGFGAGAGGGIASSLSLSKNNRGTSISVAPVAVRSMITAPFLSRDSKEFALSAMAVESPTTTKKRKMIILPEDDDDDDEDYHPSAAAGRPTTPQSILVAPVISEHQYQEEAEAYGNSNSTNNDSSKNRRRSMVRFAASPVDASVVLEGGSIPRKENKATKMSLKKKNRCRKITKKSNLSSGIDPSISWYTPHELKNIQRSVVFALKRHESCGFLLHRTVTVPSLSSTSSSIEEEEEDDDDDRRSLDRFSLRNHKRRRIVRNQMIQTCNAVREFESTSNTSQSELLSQLLHRYSNPMVAEANQIATRAITTTKTSSASPSSCSFAKSQTSFCSVDTALRTTNNIFPRWLPHQH